MFLFFFCFFFETVIAVPHFNLIYVLVHSVLKKDQFSETKNDRLETEPFVECLDCGRKLHQMCVLHLDQIWRRGYDVFLRCLFVL